MAAVTSYVSDYNAKDTKNVKPTEYRVNGVTYVADLGDTGRKAVAEAQSKAAEILRAAEAEVDAIMAEFVAIGAEKQEKKTVKPRTGDDRAASLRAWLASDPANVAALAARSLTVGDRGRIAEAVWLAAAENGWNPTASYTVAK